MTDQMRGRGVTWVAWLPWSATIGLIGLTLVLPPNSGAEVAPVDRALPLLLMLQALTFATVGLVIARSQPRNSVAWLFATVGLFVGLYLATERYQHYALVVRPGELPLGELTAWLQTWLYIPALGIFVTLLPQLFPTGRPISWRWYPALLLSGAAFIGLVLTDALEPGLIGESTIVNPYGIDPAAHGRLGEISSSLYLVAAVVGFAALVARWRHADLGQRQQLKWFAYFAALLPVFVLANAIVDVFGVREPLASSITLGLAVPAFLGLPMATAVAVLRHRLYDIDLVINRTLVYLSLTVALVLAYLAAVLVLRFVLSPVTGTSDLAVAGSTLAVAALFRPLRARFQSSVDRRFYRARYDANRTLQAFSMHLRHEVDLEALGTGLRGVVHDTLQPVHVSLWLRSTP